MRQNKRDIQIQNLNEKKTKKVYKERHFDDSKEHCQVLIDKHNKLIKSQSMKTVIVEKDPFNTRYLMKENKDPKETIENYKLSRKY